MSTSTVSTDVRCVIRIDDETFEAYEAQAHARNMEVEALLGERLSRCRTHTASQCLYFDDTQRQKLGILVGRSIATVEQALNAVRNAMSVRCGIVKGELSQRHLERLTPRAKAEHRAPEVVAWREMLRGLEEFLGMR